jgi:hypothetical protein
MRTSTAPAKSKDYDQELEILKAGLLANLDRLIFDLFGPAARCTQKEYRLGSMEGDPGTSVSIARTGPRAGLWTDFNPAGSGSGDVISLIQRRRNLDFKGAIAWAYNWLGLKKDQGRRSADGNLAANGNGRVRTANREFLARRQKRLLENSIALSWLEKRGIRGPTLRAFYLGLSETYIDSKGTTHQDALLAPVIGKDGFPINRTIYYNIPGLTLNPTAENGWMKGTPTIYYAAAEADHKSIFICEGSKDLWRMWQALHDYDNAPDLLLISSTHGSAIPEEWKKSVFWAGFDLVFLGHDNDAAGDKTAQLIAQVAGHEIFRVRPPKEKGKDWTDFWQNGGTISEFNSLLAEARLISEEIIADVQDQRKPGRYDYKPIDIATAFHRGHLYYPVRTLNNSLEPIRDETGHSEPQLVTRIETVVVRSDRTVHAVREEPAPKGTPPEERVLRLTDGTLIESRPKASVYSTWSWASINAYREGRGKFRELETILKEINIYLRQSVWLPYECDYEMLTLLIPVTYAQAIFQSVPMILAVGPPGSGKSALGRAMSRVCANAASVGQASAAGIARLIHETKGFVVMDDLESVGNRSGKEIPQFNELIQALKLSYNKETSWKIWTDVSRGMRVERLNFFGVKMINNTTGADNILGSRMLRVQTRKIPDDLKGSLGIHEEIDASWLNSLRDELHTWTFEHVPLIDDTYKRLFPQPTDRATEIAAPLSVFARIAGDESLERGLEQVLMKNRQSVADPDDPIEVMKEAMKRLVKDGYREVSTTHVVLEMKTLVDQNTDRHLTNEIAKWEDPAWVGRQLRTHDIIDVNSQGARQWLFGKSLRIYPIKDHFIVESFHGEEDRNPGQSVRKPMDFCIGCRQCSYRIVGCPIMESRLEAEKQRGNIISHRK